MRVRLLPIDDMTTTDPIRNLAAQVTVADVVDAMGGSTGTAATSSI